MEERMTKNTTGDSPTLTLDVCDITRLIWVQIGCWISHKASIRETRFRFWI